MATTVDTLDEATELARRLQDRGRLRPAVVITIAAAQAEPWVDVAEVESGVAGLADVVVLATGALTRQFQEKMPPRTHVFGGASRVYPTSDEWQTDPYRSPLRFAYGPADSTRVAEQLVTDALGMAVSAGLVRQRRERSVAAEAVVRGFPVPSRAIVAVSGGMATIQQELTFAGVPLERVVSPGQFVRGLLDRQERTLDVRPFATEPAQVLAAYELGIVVLARVRSVHAEVVELDLHPDVVVSVTIAEVTGNPYDQLTSLLSPGEVVPARLTGWAPGSGP